jgi:predicted methyltransferase
MVCVMLAGACRRRHFGPNDAYRDPTRGAEVWDDLFQSESRELYRERNRIMALAAVRPGMTVADVGAGTGLFSMMLSDAVGPEGRVYAEDIIDKFTRFVAERAEREKRTNVVSVAGTERGVGLPPSSIDLAFLCDVYHHFSGAAVMLTSVRRALRPRGELFLVDFRRERDSPAWVLEHVRAGEDTVVREVEQMGFEVVSRDHSLHDNYVVRFRRSE